MRFIDEYRDTIKIKKITERIKSSCRGKWTLMEVCGGQTHSILKFGLEELLPENISFIHGPGCPVCVIPVEYIDKAIAISKVTDIILVTYGDMLRVPGSRTDLLTAKAEGSDIRIIYSPLDAVTLAENNPSRKIVFFAIGFETTAPANAMAVLTAKKKNLHNFSMLSAQVIIPPAIELLLSSTDIRIQGLIAPGHVCTVTGYKDYIILAKKYNIPVAITGFEPVDILSGVLKLVEMLERGTYDVSNQYSRSVDINGNTVSKNIIRDVYELTDRKWRGIGVIPRSGLKLKKGFEEFDAEKIFTVNEMTVEEFSLCAAGEVLRGLRKPVDCPAFQKLCTPENPLGAPMVSSEGVCSAYYRYKIFTGSIHE